MSKNLTITTLVDNAPYDKRLGVEFGYSLLITYGKHNIMFDTGYSNLFLQNAKKLAIDLNIVDTVVISHRHKSHSGGIPHLVRVLKNETEFIIEPRYFQKFSKNINGKISYGYIDYIESIEQYLSKHKKIIVNNSKLFYKENIYFLLPNDTLEHKYPLNKFNIRNALAMIIDTLKGLFVFIGAAHSRLSMILDLIYENFPNKPIEVIFGGINVNFKRERDVEIVRNSINKIKIKHFELSHCSSKKEYEFLKELVENVYFNGAGKVLRYSDL
jgi:7,8-dihydropterin-6-yl-methyl-4-(beta-D-ribofuranosyl)aminobenzene 5'-phosphate synthase